MLLFLDSCSHYNTSQIVRKWSAIGNGTPGILPTGGRRGAGCLAMSNGSATPASVVRAVPAGLEWVVGFAFRYNLLSTVSMPILAFQASGSAQCDLRLTTGGLLTVTRNGTVLTGGTSAGALAADAWHYIEWRVTVSTSIAAGSCVVRVNAVPVITADAGQSTRHTTGSEVNQVRLGAHGSGGGATITWRFCDIYICNQSGSRNNDFLGDVRVDALLPAGAGASADWTPSAGANWQCVDESPPTDDTDYVASSTPGDTDTYQMGDLPHTPPTVLAVQTCIYSRKDDAGSRSIAPVLRSGGADHDGATVSLGDTYAYHCQLWETEPATDDPWDVTSVNAIEAGMTVVS